MKPEEAVQAVKQAREHGGDMSRRTRAREVVLQILYEDDLNPDRNMAASDHFLVRRLNNDLELIDFARGLLAGVRRSRAELDQLLTERADNWTLDRMAVTDRNVLRLGAYEILHTDTPQRVAINEAVELAKRFGARQSAHFVNGILDRFMKK
jgi:N utilization substance protein B